MFCVRQFRGRLNFFQSTAFYSLTAADLQVKSPVPPINIPNITLNEYIWQKLDKWHDKTALVCAETGRKYLYSDVFKKSRGLANYLNKCNLLRKRDTVAIVLPNVPEYPIILLGAIEAELQVTTINPNYTSDEMCKQLLDSRTRVVFTTSALYDKVKKAISATFTRTHIQIIRIKETSNEDTPRDAIKFEEISQPCKQLDFQSNTKSDDVIILPYSSGTTGLPKGVELTQKNIVSVLHMLNAEEFKTCRDAQGSHQDILPHILPMFHIYGMVAVALNLLLSGAKMITMPKFSPDIFLNVLENHKPTIAYFVPPLILMMINNPNIAPRHITQMREIVSGGAPLGPEDSERFDTKTGGKVTLLQGYGLTETSPTLIHQTSKLKNGIKEGGIGFAVSNTECKIVSVEESNFGTTLGANLTGEVVVRGPQVMKGYLNDPKATKEVLDENGWFRTGDIGHYDEDGHFFITGRLKELIKVKGFQVAPAELESLLRTHPNIEDAAVVGVSHGEFGEAPKAFVVLKKDSNVTASKIQDYIAEKVVKYKHLVGGVVFLDNIPKSASGKILRRELRDL